MLANPSTVSYCAPPSFTSRDVKRTAAQAEGCRYEAKVFDHLSRWAPGHGYELKVHPWLSYVDIFGVLRYCQLDCFLFSQHDDNLLVVEVKLRHTRSAFTQLAHYRDLALQLHKERTPSTIEICRYFDSRELNVALLDTLRPHDYSKGAAVVWDPRYEGFDA